MMNLNYNSDLELNPSKTNHYGNTDYGHNLADKILEKRNKKGKRVEKISEIFEKYFPKSLNQPRINIKLKGLLGRLKRAGVKIKSYSEMNYIDKWNYANSLKKEFDFEFR